jgi:hypothetical protein
LAYLEGVVQETAASCEIEASYLVLFSLPTHADAEVNSAS